MSTSHKLSLQQKQSQVMTKDLQQAIKLLQLSSQELDQYLDEALLENPLLEYKEEEAESDKAQDDLKDAEDINFDVKDAEAPDTDEADVVQVKQSTSSYDSDDHQEMLNNIEDTLDLRSFLTQQLFLEIDDPAQRAIGTQLIDALDDNGYLLGNLTDIQQQLGCTQDDVEQVILVLQQFDPVGIFARSVKECLSLQLKQRDQLDKIMLKLLDHLDKVGSKDLKALIKLCHATPDDILMRIDLIKALNPRPASDYHRPELHLPKPDLLVTAKGTDFQVEFNPELIPHIRINHPYYEQLKQKNAQDKNDKDYIKHCFQSGSWLIKAVEQRRKNILKVARAIIAHQHAFLTQGVHALKPLLMKEIALATNLSESTVSRVTDHKYMLTPRGLFELKFFFTTAVDSRYSGHDAHSAEAVRHRIKELIESEKYPNILADDMLVKLLRQEGIELARRTVSKYREAMGISSSFTRRKQKKPFN